MAKNKGGRPKGSKSKPKGLEEGEESSPTGPLLPTPKPLPTDPGEREAALRSYKFFVKPAVKGVSRVFRHMGVDPLDNDEIESGTEAFAAVAYQYAGEVDSKFLLMIWVISVIGPRVLQYLDKKAEEKKRLESGQKQLESGVQRAVSSASSPATNVSNLAAASAAGAA